MEVYRFIPTDKFQGEQIASFEEISYNGPLSREEINNLEAIKAVSKAFGVHLFMNLEGYNNFLNRMVMVSPERLTVLIFRMCHTEPGNYKFDGYTNRCTLISAAPQKPPAPSTIEIDPSLIKFQVSGYDNTLQELSHLDSIEYVGNLPQETKDLLEAFLAVCAAYKVDILMSIKEYHTFLKGISKEGIAKAIAVVMKLKPGKHGFDGVETFTILKRHESEVDGVCVPLESFEVDGDRVFPLSKMSFKNGSLIKSVRQMLIKLGVPSEVELFASVKSFKQVFGNPLKITQIRILMNLKAGKYVLTEDGNFRSLT